MRPTWIALVLAALLLIGFAFYRYRHSSQHLNVEPHAAEVIEKAKKQK